MADLDPSWLQCLASLDGVDLPSSLSIRPALAERLLAQHAQRMKQRGPTSEPGTATIEMPGDARRVDDVLDQDPDGSRPYYIIRRLGEGGMGVVDLARQRSTGREVAIKAIHAERKQSGYLAAFRQECRTTASLEHPHVPPVYDAGSDFMVMKRLTGRNLEDHLLAVAPGERLAERIEVLLKVCDALAYAHARGVVHRDVKGDNVMVGAWGEVWLMDWGLAAAFAPSHTGGRWLAPRVRERQEMCAGTPMCVAPEVALADPQQLGPGIDVFMIGALLYRVLCGHYPYAASSATDSVRLAGKRQMAALLGRAPQSPFRLVQAAERAMAWEPSDRGTVGDFASDLRTWLHTSGAAAEARTLIVRAGESLARAAAAPTAADSYRAFTEAIADADLARQVCPESREAHELGRRAREAFSEVALAAGDRTLADLVMRGFTPPGR